MGREGNHSGRASQASESWHSISGQRIQPALDFAIRQFADPSRDRRRIRHRGAAWWQRETHGQAVSLRYASERSEPSLAVCRRSPMPTKFASESACATSALCEQRVTSALEIGELWCELVQPHLPLRNSQRTSECLRSEGEKLMRRVGILIVF